jgi:hypothetical protein
MLIHDDIFSWRGFGGVFQLSAGRCRLRIFDLSRGEHHNVTPLRPTLVVVSDLPDDDHQPHKLSVRSCTSHVATSITTAFGIDPQRMIYVEYTPPSVYGEHRQFSIPAKYDTVDFTWYEGKALYPHWRPLTPPLLRVVADLIAATPASVDLGSQDP